MEINTNKNSSKHMRSFWPILIIIVIALVLSGFILYAANNSEVQDEIYSATLFPRSLLDRTPVKCPTGTKYSTSSKSSDKCVKVTSTSTTTK